MKKTIKVKFEDFYEGFMETARRKDYKEWKKSDDIFIEIEGEVVETDYKFKVKDIVFVKPYTETPLMCERRVCGNRWGEISSTNENSPKKVEEGESYFVIAKNGIGGWEKVENIEIIVPFTEGNK